VIEPLARVVQLVIAPVERVTVELVAALGAELSHTERGSGGFGWTGT